MGNPNKFTTEFKCNALAYYFEHKGEITKSQVAKNLGVSLSALDRWAKDPSLGGGDHKRAASGILSGDLEAENRRLLKENARLKEEREILKKAAAFFASAELKQMK